MNRCFIPFFGEEPLTIQVNGHDLVIVSFDESAFEDSDILNSDLLDIIEDDFHDVKSPTKDIWSQKKVEIRTIDLENIELNKSFRMKSTLKDIKAAKDNIFSKLELAQVKASNIDRLSADKGNYLEEFIAEDNEAGSDLNQPILGGDDGRPEPITFQFGEDIAVPGHLVRNLAMKVAEQTRSGVIFVPPSVSIDMVLNELSEQLPWVQ
jgi:hypothetical protein